MRTKFTPLTSLSHVASQISKSVRRSTWTAGLLAILSSGAVWADVEALSGVFLTGFSGDKIDLIVNGSLSTVQVSAQTRVSTCFHHVSGTAPVPSITDGSSNTIKFGPSLVLTLQVGTSIGSVPIGLIQDGTSNTIFFPENASDSGCFAGETQILDLGTTALDGNSNTIDFGELSSFDICFRSARLGRIEDGTSNTIQFGEVETNPVCFEDVRVAPDADVGGTVPEPGSAGLLLLGLALLGRASLKAKNRSFWRSAFAIVGLTVAFHANAFVTFGQTFGLANHEFKWGDSSLPGSSGGTVTYSFLPVGTECSTFVQAAGVGRSCRAEDPQAVFGAGFESVFASVFESWSHWAQIDFVQVADDGTQSGRDGASASTGSIRIGTASYDRRTFGVGFANFGAGDGKGLDGDVLLNAAYESSFKRDPTFLTGLALHEIGHALGMAHSDVFLSTMSAFGPFFDTIQPDDIAGIQFIYGARVASEVPEPSGLALTLAGLGLLATLSQHRRRAVPPSWSTIEIAGMRGSEPDVRPRASAQLV